MEEVLFYCDIWVEVDLDVIYNNVIYIKEFILSNVEIFVVVKVNVYGYDYVLVVKMVLEVGVIRLVVVFLDEVLVFWRVGIIELILVLGFLLLCDVNVVVENDVVLMVF